jgi:cytidyltransferase-like protein
MWCAVVIGKFQPFHLGHHYLFKQVARTFGNVMVLLEGGSVFTTEEVTNFFNEYLAGMFNSWSIKPIKDSFNEYTWVTQTSFVIDNLALEKGWKTPIIIKALKPMDLGPQSQHPFDLFDDFYRAQDITPIFPNFHSSIFLKKYSKENEHLVHPLMRKLLHNKEESLWSISQ